MTSAEEWRRGDVALVSFPLVSDPAQSKLRPAVIIQNNVGNRYSPNVIVAAITSQLPKRPYPTNLLLEAGSPAAMAAGLDRSSAIQGEVILTLPKDRLVRSLGHLPPQTMAAVDRVLKVSLGLT
jgi:mRNA interferase MazF